MPSFGEMMLYAGIAALCLPTMINVARFSWSTEQGGHGPLVLATGLWLAWREWRANTPERHPAPALWASLGIALCLIIFIAARITGILEIEAFVMYFALLLTFYLLWGGPAMKVVWFPLVYLALTLPPPDTVVAAVTQPIKIAISAWAVDLLHMFGYPIANSGVTIQIAQYQLLLAAACAGLNSIISLGAICLLYAYLRHRSNMVYILILGLTVIPVAAFANFIRVLVLILITYYFGEAAAQGFIHDFAGLLMFAVALATVFAIDEILHPLLMRRVPGLLR